MDEMYRRKEYYFFISIPFETNESVVRGGKRIGWQQFTLTVSKPHCSRSAPLPRSNERLSDDESDARSCDSLQPSDRRVSLPCKRITIVILNGIDFCIRLGGTRKIFKM